MDTSNTTAFILARIQFGFTIGFHIIFPALTIGLASFLTVLEALWLKTGREAYRDLYHHGAKIFAVNFGMGVVSGVVMAWQLGTNWSRFAFLQHTCPLRISGTGVRNAHVMYSIAAAGANYTPLVPRFESPAGDAGRTVRRRSACPTNELLCSNNKSCFAREPTWRSIKPLFACRAGCCKVTPISMSPTTSWRSGSRFIAVVSEFRTSSARVVGPGGASLAKVN